MGFGTAEGETIGFDLAEYRVRLDEDTLKRIANLTSANTSCRSGADLKRVYEGQKVPGVRRKRGHGAVRRSAAPLVLLAAGLRHGGLSGGGLVH